VGKRPKATTEFVWQVVLVDRDLLERAKRATDARGASEAIDRALLLAVERTTDRRTERRGRRPAEGQAASLQLH
jgi:hypothetical protein